MTDLSRLTSSELAVVALLSHGYGTKGTAAFLGIAPKTVNVHVSNALLKAGARTRVDLVAAYARQEVSAER